MKITTSEDLIEFNEDIKEFDSVKKNKVEQYLKDIIPNNELNIDDITNSFTTSKANPYFFHEPDVHKGDSFTSLQKWEGVVLEILKDTFTARLFDQNYKGFEEIAEFYIEEIDLQDRNLLEPGAYFYWSIGYLEKAHGQRMRGSLIKFKRLPKWTQKEIDTVEEKTKYLMNELGFST